MVGRRLRMAGPVVYYARRWAGEYLETRQFGHLHQSVLVKPAGPSGLRWYCEGGPAVEASSPIKFIAILVNFMVDFGVHTLCAAL